MSTLEIARLDLHRAGGPIPVQDNARATWDRRDTILVALHDASGRVGLGEAAPLPGFAGDDLEAARNDLVVARGHATGRRLERDEPSAELVAALVGDIASPSARYAIELATLDLIGQAWGAPLRLLLAPPCRQGQIEVSALLGDAGAPAALDRAARLVREGARTLKVKLATRSIDDDLAALIALRAAIGADIVLIGDANGAWSIEEARSALVRLESIGLAYVEQPVVALADLGPTAIPIWADESLIDVAMREATLASPHVAGIVCKPTVLGGLLVVRDLAQRAAAAGKGVIVTHALEGPIALAGCAALALALADVAPRAGLWPHDALAAFPEIGVPGLRRGVLRASDSLGLGIAPRERSRILGLPRIPVEAAP